MPQTPQSDSLARSGARPQSEFPAVLAELRRMQEQRDSGAKLRVYVAGSSGEPTQMLETLKEHPSAAERLHFLQFPLPGINQFDFTELSQTTEQTVFFMSAAIKEAPRDRLHYVPIHMRRVYDYLLENPVDVALLQLARDRDGVLRVAANADFASAAVAHSDTIVIASLNEGFVAPVGAPLAPRIDYLFTGASTVPVFPGAATGLDASGVERAIGDYVASIVRDGDCLQTGIGAIPAAVLAALGDKVDLGFHGGLIDDGVFALIEQGVITGARKSIDRGLHITGIVLGSESLFQRLAQRDDVLLVGANRTHESSVIANIDNFVSINSAVQVDLLGQVNGEFAGGRQLSGTGGSVDFMRSARGSKGGRSIVALPATARGGSVSRIVQRVDMVTALRTDVDIVVTEYGIAQLRDQPLAARVTRLAAIAAPDYRPELLSVIE